MTQANEGREPITLATLPDATEQEVFDQVARHMLTQNAKSKDPGGACVYRELDHGLMCAAGCLIADDEYDGMLEEQDWDTLVSGALVPADHDYLIGKLQSIHDGYDVKVEQWPAALRELAVDFNLNTKVIEEFNV